MEQFYKKEYLKKTEELKNECIKIAAEQEIDYLKTMKCLEDVNKSLKKVVQILNKKEKIDLTTKK